MGHRRYSDMPAGPGELPAEVRNLVMHAELRIIAGHVLMATDMLRSMSQEIRIGNNTTLCLDVDSREEADRLYGALSEGSSEGSPMADMPWAPTGASSSTATAFAGWSTTPAS